MNQYEISKKSVAEVFRPPQYDRYGKAREEYKTNLHEPKGTTSV